MSLFVLKSLRVNEAIRKWQHRQKEDPEIRKIIDLIHNNDWSTYKYSKNEPSSMKSYVKVRADLELENGTGRPLFNCYMTSLAIWA